MGLTEPHLGSRSLYQTSRNWTNFYSYCKPADMSLASLGASLVSGVSGGSTGSHSHKEKGRFAVWSGHHTVYILFAASWVLHADLSSLPKLYMWFFGFCKPDFLKKTFSFLVGQGIPICWNLLMLNRYLLTFAIFTVRGSVMHFGNL